MSPSWKRPSYERGGPCRRASSLARQRDTRAGRPGPQGSQDSCPRMLSRDQREGSTSGGGSTGFSGGRPALGSRCHGQRETAGRLRLSLSSPVCKPRRTFHATVLRSSAETRKGRMPRRAPACSKHSVNGGSSNNKSGHSPRSKALCVIRTRGLTHGLVRYDRAGRLLGVWQWGGRPAGDLSPIRHFSLGETQKPDPVWLHH